MFQVLGPLTVEYIENHVDQITLMSYYLGIPEFVINRCIERNKLVCSPLRADRNPTCGFRFNNVGKLRFKDFAGYFHGDVYDVVGYLYGFIPSEPVDFNLILEQIAKDFKLWWFSDEYDKEALRPNYIGAIKERVTIECNLRVWENKDVEYWKQYGISLPTLTYFNVYPLDSIWINGKLRYMSTGYDRAYGYYLGSISGKTQWKIYFPSRKEGRFLTNSTIMQGAVRIKEAEIGILAKSLKDTMSLYEIDSNINSIAVVSESVLPTGKAINTMMAKWKNPFCFMDFDYRGITTSIKLKRYGFNPIFLTNGKYGTLNYRAKDISDFIKNNGGNKALPYLKELIEILKDNEYKPEEEFYYYLNKQFKL